jgi:hypothetical protein
MAATVLNSRQARQLNGRTYGEMPGVLQPA